MPSPSRTGASRRQTAHPPNVGYLTRDGVDIYMEYVETVVLRLVVDDHIAVAADTRQTTVVACRHTVLIVSLLVEKSNLRIQRHISHTEQKQKR